MTKKSSLTKNRTAWIKNPDIQIGHVDVYDGFTGQDCGIAIAVAAAGDKILLDGYEMDVETADVIEQLLHNARVTAEYIRCNPALSHCFPTMRNLDDQY